MTTSYMEKDETNLSSEVRTRLSTWDRLDPLWGIGQWIDELA